MISCDCVQYCFVASGVTAYSWTIALTHCAFDPCRVHALLLICTYVLICCLAILAIIYMLYIVYRHLYMKYVLTAKILLQNSCAYNSRTAIR